jgi:hypothetical protein
VHLQKLHSSAFVFITVLRPHTVLQKIANHFFQVARTRAPSAPLPAPQNIPIDSMPGVSRLGWRHGLLEAVAEARSYGVNQVVIFPKTPENLKTPTGEEAFNPDGLAQRTIKLLKDTFPDLEVYTDVALDPYNSDGHDGIVTDDGVILNDETVEYLCRQAVSQVRCSDVVPQYRPLPAGPPKVAGHVALDWLVHTSLAGAQRE